jgi:hypothetical protein
VFVKKEESLVAVAKGDKEIVPYSESTTVEPSHLVNDFDAFCEAVRASADKQRVSTWELADLLCLGESHFLPDPEGPEYRYSGIEPRHVYYEKMAEVAGMAIQSIKNLVSIARAFPDGTRDNRLSLSHYKALAPIKRGDNLFKRGDGVYVQKISVDKLIAATLDVPPGARPHTVDWLKSEIGDELVKVTLRTKFQMDAQGRAVKKSKISEKDDLIAHKRIIAYSGMQGKPNWELLRPFGDINEPPPRLRKITFEVDDFVWNTLSTIDLIARGFDRLAVPRKRRYMGNPSKVACNLLKNYCENRFACDYRDALEENEPEYRARVDREKEEKARLDWEKEKKARRDRKNEEAKVVVEK